jgi:hypothetical protein
MMNARVRNNSKINNVSTRTNNLLMISEEAKLNFDEEDILILNRVTNFNLETSYPDDKNRF